MKFIDEVRIGAKGGDGGNGAVAFRREKYIPFGGPAGGDGGHGGSVVFVANEGRTSLLDLAHLPVLRAKAGENGRGKDQYGRAGADLEVEVPIGTEVYDIATGAKIADLTTNGARAIIAHGGRGGRGNIHFATPHDRAPRRAEPGTEGEEKSLRLELKVLADVGLIGFPNVGKSTVVRAMSRARPRVADYPFTTLRPHLGVVRIGGAASSSTFVIADIPGLIPGASGGAGLGIRFLKHVERCRALLHLIAPPTDETREAGRDPLVDYNAIMHELKAFAPELARRPMIVAISKSDLPDAHETFAKLERSFAKKKVPLRLISAATGDGMKELARDLYRLVRDARPATESDDAHTPPAPRMPQVSTPRAKMRDTEPTSPQKKPAGRTVTKTITRGKTKATKAVGTKRGAVKPRSAGISAKSTKAAAAGGRSRGGSRSVAKGVKKAASGRN